MYVLDGVIVIFIFGGEVMLNFEGEELLSDEGRSTEYMDCCMCVCMYVCMYVDAE